MTCSDCKHFNQSENYSEDEGWCDLDLPPWVHRAMNVSQYDADRTVRVDDSCSFFEENK